MPCSLTYGVAPPRRGCSHSWWPRCMSDQQAPQGVFLTDFHLGLVLQFNSKCSCHALSFRNCLAQLDRQICPLLFKPARDVRVHCHAVGYNSQYPRSELPSLPPSNVRPQKLIPDERTFGLIRPGSDGHLFNSTEYEWTSRKFVPINSGAAGQQRTFGMIGRQPFLH